jgi:hypothetical protein
MSNTLILPAAGLSTRFHKTRPKWMLTHPSGDIMILQGIKGLPIDLYDEVIFIFLNQHIREHNFDTSYIYNYMISTYNKKCKILILDKKTSSEPETVKVAIEKYDIKGNFLIKDCDSYFNADYCDGDYIYTYSLYKDENIKSINKSFVEIEENGIIKNIIEKKVINDVFCVGGYGFSSPDMFIDTYNKVRDINKSNDNIYISHIIHQIILDNKTTFYSKDVSNYFEWGTFQDWKNYTDKFKTIFIDLDGVLIENYGEFEIPKNKSRPIIKNVNLINRLYDEGKCRIIITTARKSSRKKDTLKQLENLNIKYHNIIFDLFHCKRYLINDFSSTNNYPSSIAININRNDDNLENFIS